MGPAPAMSSGTVTTQWEEYGIPTGWENYIAGVGYDLDGESGPNPLAIPPGTGGPGGDGSIGISIPIELAGAGPANTVQLVVTTTYGALTPLGQSGSSRPCPWDCEPIPDGAIGINDFLELLAQWAMLDSSCDLCQGAPGVGVEDFLDLLSHWGDCDF